MKIIKNIFVIVLLSLGSTAFGQINLDQQVIGSTGGFHQVVGGNSYSYTVGETMVLTQATFSVNMILTQGFQQSTNTIIIPPTADSTSFDVEILNATCTSGGSIIVTNVQTCSQDSANGFTVTITSVNDSMPIIADSLAVGSYNVVVAGDSCSTSIIVEVGFDDLANCDLKFYSGITPNGDGNNDIWSIDNIELYPENTVQIFNRWGTEVWFGEGYDNVNTVWVGLNKNGVQMVDGTYFYVAKIGDEIHKGWIELTR